jgi:hypothetical protein
MRHLLILLAAMSVVACHSRNEDETAAAPANDSTITTRPGEAGSPGNATVPRDSVMHDSTNVKPDSTLGDTVSAP